MTQEEWLEKYTFRCPDIHANVTPEQCAMNRKRNGGWDSAGQAPKKIETCMSCTKYEERIATVKKRRNIKEAIPMAKRGNVEKTDDIQVKCNAGQPVMSIGDILLVRHVTRRGGGVKPFASIRCGDKSIEVALNSAAVVKFGLKKVKYVDVYKSVEGNVLALVPLDEPKDSSSVQLRTTSGENTRIVSATAALREMGIKENGRYSVRQEQGVVIIDFKKEAA